MRNGTFIAVMIMEGAAALVSVYGDVNDPLALDIIAELYPTRKVVGINCLDLALFGGMVHCVTQQQPALGAEG